MIQLSIIGSGNVAQHLIRAFIEAQNKGAEIELMQVYSRQPENVAHLIDADKVTSHFHELIKVDICIIAVSDDAINKVSAQLPFKNQLVAHTSGTVSIDDLDNQNRKAVFYPLQTFSKNKAIHFREVPICLESQNETDFQLVEKVAKTISDTIYPINSEQRKALHLAAVFVNNFVNHLYQIGNTICKEHQVPFEILKPLIRETAEKIMTLSPNEAQTGPAKRKDIHTIKSHLELISNDNYKNIYKLLTQSIQTDGKKL